MDRNPYYRFYLAQVGSGGGSILHQEHHSRRTLPYYRTHFVVQAGRGWFGNTARAAWNFLRPIFTHVGGEALSAGKDLAKDVLASGTDNLKEKVLNRGKQALGNLAQRAATHYLSGKGRGGGRRRKRKRILDKTGDKKKSKKANQSPSGSRRERKRPRPPPQQKKTLAYRHPAAIRDIFSPPSP